MTKILAVIAGTEGDFVQLALQNGGSIPSIVKDATGLVESLGPTFVFRPGGVAAGNVYTTFPTLMAAVGGIAGNKWIAVDASLATATVPAGTWNVDGVTFANIGAADNVSGSGGVLNFANGAIFTGRFAIDGFVTFISQSSAPVYLIDDEFLVLTNGATIQSAAGAAPFISQVGANTGLIEIGNNGGLGDSIHAACTIAAGQSLLINLVSQGSILAHAMAGTGTLNLFPSSDATFDRTGWTTTQVITLQSIAGQVSYTPEQASNWNPVPNVVGGPNALGNPGALDLAVFPNSADVINSGSISPFATLSLPGPGQTRIRAGLFLVTGIVSGTDSTTEVIAITLVRDGATVIGPTIKVPTALVGSPDFTATISWVDHITDALPHVWSVNAVGGGGGTLTVGVGQASIQATEL
jgi:hypothetical protein